MPEGEGNGRAMRVENERADVSSTRGSRRAAWRVAITVRSVPLTRIHSPGSAGWIAKDKSLKP